MNMKTHIKPVTRRRYLAEILLVIVMAMTFGSIATWMAMDEQETVTYWNDPLAPVDQPEVIGG